MHSCGSSFWLGDIDFFEGNTIDRQLFFLLQYTEIVKEKKGGIKRVLSVVIVVFSGADPFLFL